MKRQILLLLLLFGAIEAFCQLPPSNVIDLGKHGPEEEFALAKTIDTKFLPNTIFGEAADVWYKLEVLWPMSLHIHTYGSCFKTFGIYILDENLEKVADNSGADHSVEYEYPFINLEWYVEPGTYYIVNEGYSDKDNYSEYPLTMALEGSPDGNTFMNLGTWGSSFQKSFTQNTSYGFDSFYRGSGESVKDMTYQISFEYPMSMIVSHCGTTQSPGFIAILNENGKILYRSDRDDQDCGCDLNYGEYHAYIKTDILPPGTYRIVSEGMDWEGPIVTNIQGIEIPAGDMKDKPFYIGWHSADFEYSDVRDTREFTDHYQGVSGNDVFYQFGLEVPMDIILSHCGSAVDETFIYLLDSEGNRIASSADYSGDEDCSNRQTAFISKKELPEGTYYVVSEGYSEDGEIATHIQGLCSQLNVDSYSGNFIFTRSFMNAAGSKYLDKIDYFDGFGRREESVQKQYSPSGGDLVTLQEYDGFNRPSNLWLPAVFADNGGQYVSSAAIKNAVITQYDDSKPFSKTVYESSPLNRELERYGPGERWHTDSRSVETSYLTNIWGNDTLNCINFELKISNDTLPYIVNRPNYPSSELYVTRIQDEDGNTSFEFKDKLGQVILTRRIEYQAGGKNLYDTYYLYDDYGNCVIVLPPEASAAIAASGSLSFTGPNSPILRDYAYMYQYDSRNRCIAKKLPGCDWRLYIYDKTNRLIFSQDGNLRQKNEWLFSIPDLLGRVVLTGTCTNTFSYSSSPLLGSIVKGEPNNQTNTTKGYLVSGVTLENPVILSANYYDDYSFTGHNGISDSTDSSVKYEVYAEFEGFGKRYMPGSKGLLTGTLTARLDDSSTSLDYLYSVMYYDHHGRIVQAKSGNHLSGGLEKEYYRYNFTGQPLKRKHVHLAKDQPSQSEVYNYVYDHAGRLLTTVHQLNDSPSVTLVDNEYDELGRLKCNKRNGQPSLQTDYAYNIRSWTKSISSPLFNQTLYYNDSRSGGTNPPCYNGNISAMDWSVANDKSRGYDFSYDALSRLTGADYLEDNTRSDKFSTSYSYDKHGNILSLIRSGNRGTTTYGEIDNLTLSYQGNQLIKVEDTAPAPTLSMSMDFKDGTDQEIEYSYDTNGNQTKDLNKGITSIEYNFLNLPRRINFSGTNIPKNEYVYSAAGTKLSVIHKSTTEQRTDYVGNMIYENGSLKRILVDGGYIENGVYHFYIQDHLGNNRVVIKSDGTVIQANHYYPYGMSFAEGTFADKQPYKYNGKDLDNENGLNWYDYGARYYDANLGRWHVVDPMAEEDYGLSPYNYCFNNPFKLIDPNGMWPGNPLLPPFGRYQYGSNAAVNSFKFIHNTVAAIVNTPINIINQLADETGYIYNNGVGSYLSSGTQNIGDAISSELAYRVNTPISQQAADTWQSMKDPQNWENATATAALMLSPMKRGSTAITQSISVIAKEEVKGTIAGTTAFRYMTEGELNAIQNTGLLRGGRVGETYWTKDLYKSASSTQNRLALPSTPTLRVEFEILNNPILLRNGTKVLPANGMTGKGAEFMTLDPVRVNLINWQPLR